MSDEIIKKYLTIDHRYIKNISSSNPLKSKDILWKILKWWKILSNSNTIGDLSKVNGNFPLIFIKIGSNTYYVNADSTKDGVKIFLAKKENPWVLINNDNGVNNKITNSLFKEPVKGFYMYKK
jgi:hypothetical protein|tara:strand:- start:518 stop:886 length:369 start_codon:yes stop_codon:yes gene_type:complete